ncbi:WD40 repeat domain-containing protein [Sulfurimonas sp.]
MLDTSQCLRTRSDILEVKKLDDNLIAMCTSSHGAKIFSLDECSTKSTLTHEHLTFETSSVSFSQNSEFMAFSNKSNIYILHMPSKIAIKTIKVDNETVEMVEFDSESKYIIATTTSGRVLQYRYDGSSLLARLYSFDVSDAKERTKDSPSLVSALAFHKDILAIGGNDGSVLTINLHSRANKIFIQNNNSRVTSLCFLDSNTLISADNKGNIYFNSLKNKELTKKIETGFTKVSQIVLMPDPNYLIVTGNENYIAVYDIKNFKLLHNKYMQFDDIVKNIIIASQDTLLVTLKDNSLQKVQLPNAFKIRTFIVHSAFDKAYRYVEQHAILKTSKEYLALELAYMKVYDSILEALVNQNKDKALEISKVFKYVDSKQNDIQELFKAFENYPRLKSLYMEKKYALAYTICAKFPPLQKTFYYEKMEEMWKDTFKNAQRQIAHGSVANAKTLLNEYVTVLEKRPIIKLILSDNNNFIEFLKAIETKDFQIVEKIAKTNDLFTQVPTYKSVEENINLAIVDVQKDIDSCKLDSAIKKLTKLHHIDSVKAKVDMQKKECIAIKKLQDAYAADDFIKCYEILDKHNSLNSTTLGAQLQKHWFKIISKCEEFALKGNIKDIKLTLGDLIHLSTRRDKIGDLFRVSFHVKIKGLMAAKAYKKSEGIIYSYIDIFGLDNEIISIMKLQERISKTKLAITQNQNDRHSRDSWINSDIIMGQ